MIFFREGERHPFVVPLIYGFIGWCLLCVLARVWTATVAYQDNALTNWAFPARAWNSILLTNMNAQFLLHPSIQAEIMGFNGLLLPEALVAKYLLSKNSMSLC